MVKGAFAVSCSQPVRIAPTGSGQNLRTRHRDESPHSRNPRVPTVQVAIRTRVACRKNLALLIPRERVTIQRKPLVSETLTNGIE